MYRITFTITGSEKNLIEEQLFALGAASISSAPVKNGDLTLTVLTEDPGEIKRYFKGKDLHVARLTEKDWKNSWLNDYHGSLIGDDIFAGPDPEALEAKKYRYFIHLDPRDAFGDGRHPTTILCIKRLIQVIKEKRDDAGKLYLLDAGTGSGIIAIAAEKLGIGHIEAVELDENACTRAGENITRNNCRAISLHHGDIASFVPFRDCDIVVANLLTAVIQKNIHHLKKITAPGGNIIASGIGTEWKKEIENTFKENRLFIISCDECDGWLCYHLKISP